MKPPNVTPPPTAQQSTKTEQPGSGLNISQQQAAPTQTTSHVQVAGQHPTNTAPTTATTVQQSQPQLTTTTTNLKESNTMTHTNITPQPIITTQAIVVLKPATIGSHQEQQAPLALTTQPQNKISIQTSSTLQTQQPQQPAIPTVASSSTISVHQHQSTTHATKDTNNITRTNLTPQALITTQANIVAKPVTINSSQEQQAPLALITQFQPKTQNQATSSPTLQQQQPAQPTPQVPVAATTANAKQDTNRNLCCLLDQGVKCDRIAGNASFSARIQKIVASKRMNFSLDSSVKHSYICDHHKAVITVAKKSVTTARESKATARSLAAASNANSTNANTLPPHHINNYNDLPMNQGTIPHPVNLELMTNQGRITNNHTGMLISMPIRPGTQIAYSHYPPGTHPNQVGRMDHAMMSSSGFDNAGGDNVPSSSGGVEVDLQQLQVNTLRRYKRHFRVQTRPGLNKMQLAESLKHHFRTLPIIEKEAITYFVYIVKSSRNKLDHNPKAD